MMSQTLSRQTPMTTSSGTASGRAIFLDFDGVLHPSTAIEGLDITLPLDVLKTQNQLFRWASLLANMLEGHEDVMLFAHSSWRFSLGNTAMRQALGPLGRLYEGVTNPDQRNRMASITETVKRAALAQFIVLDDARDEFPPDFANLVLCNPLQGLSDVAVQSTVKAWLETTQPATSQV